MGSSRALLLQRCWYDQLRARLLLPSSMRRRPHGLPRVKLRATSSPPAERQRRAAAAPAPPFTQAKGTGTRTGAPVLNPQAIKLNRQIANRDGSHEHVYFLFNTRKKDFSEVNYATALNWLAKKQPRGGYAVGLAGRANLAELILATSNQLDSNPDGWDARALANAAWGAAKLLQPRKYANPRERRAVQGSEVEEALKAACASLLQEDRRPRGDAAGRLQGAGARQCCLVIRDGRPRRPAPVRVARDVGDAPARPVLGAGARERVTCVEICRAGVGLAWRSRVGVHAGRLGLREETRNGRRRRAKLDAADDVACAEASRKMFEAWSGRMHPALPRRRL